jgi:hypothetical protein
MINPRDIEAKVRARLHGLRRAPITEDLIHEAYKAFMFEAIDDARKGLAQLGNEIEQSSAHHPTQGWTMMSKEQRERLHDHVKDLQKMVSPYVL